MILRNCLILAFLFALSFSSKGQQSAPNIIFIMADDVGAECLQSYGGQSYRTPNLDKLANEGMRFTNVYATPLCTPTRVQVMTGQYPFRNGWAGGIWKLPEKEQRLDPNTYNFGRMMKEAGYTTAVAGKWQLGRFDIWPDQVHGLGFDEYCLWTWSYAKEVPSSIQKEEPARKHLLSWYWNPGIFRNGEIMKDTEGKYGPDIYNDFLLGFIEKNRNRPFFIYYPMVLAHFPFVGVPGVKKGQTEQENFADMIEYMDMLVGKIVQKTVDLGIGDNTVIIFTGDNGNDQRLQTKINGEILKGGKGRLTDAGTRVPLIVKWPVQIKEKMVVDEMIDLTDILPTLSEISGAGISVSHQTDGNSFLPLLRGNKDKTRDWVFCQLEDKWFIRSKNYRLHNNGDFYYLPAHYHPEEVDFQDDNDAKEAKSKLKKALAGLGVN